MTKSVKKALKNTEKSLKNKHSDNRIKTDKLSNIPIYIICYNRLSYLQKIIQWLEKYNLNNIHIIDNCSSYPPLLEYLKKTPYKVHKMKENLGHMVFFKADEFKQIRENEYYILTDPDVIPIEECPIDFINYFFQILQNYPNATKVGFSLKTDDLNENMPTTEVIRKWEKQFYKKKLTTNPPYLYDSCLDTTFAMYRPMKKITKDNFYKAIRTGYPYEARHLPWYKDLSVLDEEDEFYNKTDAGSGNWNNLANLDCLKDELISRKPNSILENIFSVKKSYRRIIIRFLWFKFTINCHKRQ